MFRPFYLLGWIGGAFACVGYLASLGNVLRVLYLCATTEPGIILKIRARSVNYQKAYKVAYLDQTELTSAMKELSSVEAFFDLNRFKVVVEQDDQSRDNESS